MRYDWNCLSSPCSPTWWRNVLSWTCVPESTCDMCLMNKLRTVFKYCCLKWMSIRSQFQPKPLTTLRVHTCYWFIFFIFCFFTIVWFPYGWNGGLQQRRNTDLMTIATGGYNWSCSHIQYVLFGCGLRAQKQFVFLYPFE